MIRTIASAFVIFLAYTLQIQGQQPFKVPETLERSTKLSDYLSVWVDRENSRSIEELLVDDSVPFLPADKVDLGNTFPLTLWYRLELEHDHDLGKTALFSFCHYAEEVDLYEIDEGKVVYTISSGKHLRPSDKPFISDNNTVYVYFPANSSKLFYARVHYLKEVPRKHLVETFLLDIKQGISSLLFRHSGQVFYAGLMLMFAFVSLAVFILFRDRSFLYFGMVHLAFVLYFMAFHGSFDIYLFVLPIIGNTSHASMSISLLLLTFSIFVAHYLQLRSKSPRYFRFYQVVSAIAVLNIYAIQPWLNNIEQSLTINNVIILIWIIVTFFPIAQQAHRKNKKARVLLISMLVLVLSAVIYILAITGKLPRNFFTTHSIQVGTFIFAILVFYKLFEMVKAINEEKQQALSLNAMKSKFLANISHEFRTPLTLLIGPLEQLLGKLRDPKEAKMMERSLRSAKRLLSMVNQLLDLSKLENDRVQLYVEEREFISFLKGLTMSFESMADIREIEIEFSSDVDSQKLWFDKEKMEVIFVNLLSNAFKFTPDGGKVSVFIKSKAREVEVQVLDTGIGIDAEQLPHIFDRFYRVENDFNISVEGSGIGLSLSKELLELHEGSISVQSIPEQGSSFTVTLKKGREHFPDEFLFDNVENISASASSVTLLESSNLQAGAIELEPQFINSDRPTILLVEDNVDVREYLREQLIEQFNVLEAGDGQIGFQVALEHVPDLVVSDVMMPNMNGFELCKKLKEDVRTSHIPIILLTAKVEQDDKLEGLELGADDYLTKPFHARELNVRIRKLIELRIQLRKAMLESPLLSFKSLEGSPVEKAFLEEVGRCVDEHLSDPGFGIDVFAQKLAMSKPSLNRKLKSITGLTPNKFIQHKRLQKALLLIESGEMSVSEVAFETGFGSTSYFVKCFRDHFGKTPGAI